MTRVLVALAVVAVLLVAAWVGLALAAYDDSHDTPGPVRVVEVQPGVWACTQDRVVVPCTFLDAGHIFPGAKK